MPPTAAPELTRQRLDYQTLPGGAVKAILTVSLPGGVVKRFSTTVTKEEAEGVEGEIVAGEILLNPEVGFNLGKAFKKVGRVVKHVANSKIFKLAAKGLALAAPLLGPIAPVALAAAAGMGVASKLASAGVAAAKGATELASALTHSAASDARRLTSTPAGAASLLAAANKRRLGAEKLANRGAPPPRAQPSARPTAPAPSSSDEDEPASGNILAHARAGRVRSNDGKPVNPDQLLKAHREGRIFWVSI